MPKRAIRKTGSLRSEKRLALRRCSSTASGDPPPLERHRREGAREDDELDGNQLHFTIRLRLIDQGLRFRGVELSIADQSFSVDTGH